jgi:N-acetylglucosaminyldiphosphoundecaprenol N-acetyl-beta-D-mannosaminyltransferase
MLDKHFEFLGLNFNNITLQEIILQFENFIEKKNPHMIFSINAELLVRANEDHRLRNLYRSAKIATLDGYVAYYAARLFRKPIKEPVSAARMMFEFLPVCNEKKYRIYLLGAKEDVVLKVRDCLCEQYKEINIVGWQNGYFDFNKDEDIVSDIKSKKVDVLFVAMSSPLKENFLSKNIDKMNVPVCIGVGGGFDIIAGECKLAPEWIRKIGMEWFYRFIQEPRRLWKRYLVTNTKFILLILKEIFFRRR